ncbi:hypothetical protein E4U41_005113 [Claviceps citrina]|nr:hypothetical protein E4U41_005113 [Claviceps citrina]
MDQPRGSWAAQAPDPEKSSELYIRDLPHRSIAIVSSSHALILRYSSAASGDIPHNGSVTSVQSVKFRGGTDSDAAKCMVGFSPLSTQLLKDYRPLTPRPVYGTLGLIAANGEVFLSVITRAVRAATIRPGETVEKISTVDFYCLSSADYDDVVPLESVEPDVSDALSTLSTQSGYGRSLGRREVSMEHPCHELRKLLSNGSFYYSTDFDLTNRLQDRSINSTSFDIDNFDDTYLWNSFMIRPLVEFRSRLMPPEREALDSSRILTSATRGFCKTMTIPQSASPIRQPKNGMPSYFSLISRLSCRRAGTRFNARGIDDDGNVANFVETETIFCSPAGTLFSYVQVRGSVPVFWEQAADLLPGRQKITVTRSREGTQPAFNKHIEELEQIYGAVHIINLLSDTKPAEVELSDLYRHAIRRCPYSQSGGSSAEHALLQDTHYDFHAETKGPAGYEAAKDIRKYVEGSTDGFAYFLAEETDDSAEVVTDTHTQRKRMVVVLQQDGVFRTNCLDCLDRTNLIQTLISQMAVEAFLAHRSDYAASDFWMRHSSLWADNGDSLSKIYAGTGALKTSFTRHGKMSLAGAMADMRKSVQRIYHNNFIDPSRQVTIDMLLGRLIQQSPVHLFDPISDFVSMELARRSDEYTSSETITLWTGTFNLNGRTDGIGHDLSPWLFGPAAGVEQPDVYAVAFQEIVELSPQQIMNSDPSRKHLWEAAVKRALNQRQASLGGERYVLLRSGQLVGAALCIFVKTSRLKDIKNVEGSVKKTGLSNMAGNKGAVAIRFDYANTPICFVTAHLAAGFSNYEERNRDYATIHHGLRFQRNRGIEDHDAIIWMGDFNYRIGLGLEKAKALVKKRDIESLYENDQLNLQMVAGLAFPFYSEARIGFMPTYKFDVGTDNYDSSEKARIPAWTDRILRKGSILRQLSYESAPLRFSDHRPVYATFECRVNMINEKVRQDISRELYQRRKADVGGDATAALGEGEDSDDEDLIGYDSIEPGLPPASSDRQKWWLDNRQPARAHMTVPNGRDGLPMTLNPHRPSNPFGQTDEPDWVSVSRSPPGHSSLSSSPYEKVSLPKALATTRQGPAVQQQVARKQLPPSYDASKLPGLVGRLRAGDQEGHVESHSDAGRNGTQTPPPPPPPPPPRRQTVHAAAASETGPDRRQTPPPSLPTTPRSTPGGASTAPQVSQLSRQLTSKGGKSPPPPVGKKPAHLATGSPLLSSKTVTTGLMTGTSTRGDGATSQPALAAGSARKAVGVGVAQQQQPSFAGRPGQSGTADAGSASASASVDLLDSLTDGYEDGMGGWEALQPT